MVRIVRKYSDERDLLNRLILARQNMRQIQDEITELEGDLIKFMETNQRKSVSAKVGTMDHRVTYVRSKRVKVDEKGLKKALGARLFNKFTVTKLDTKKLESGLDEGLVAPEAVSPYITEELSNPYLRYSGSRHEAGA